MHGDHAIAAINAGKHVMSEKPIDVSLAKADAMIAAAKAKGVTLACISQNRYGKGNQQLHKWLDEGRLGRIVYGEAAVKWYRSQQYYDSGDWRGTWALDGGGALMNQGVHYVDQLRWAMGKPKTVVARMATLGHKMECEDVVTSMIEFESGALGSLTATTCAYPGYETRLEVYGMGGSVRIVNNDIEIARFTDGSEYTAGVTDIADTGSSHPTNTGIELHLRQLSDFIHAIKEGRSPEITAEDGRNALQLVLAVYESARAGEVVRL
jgi:predicted dehydrogenase